MVHSHVFFVGAVPQNHDASWLQDGLDQVGAELLVGMIQREVLCRRLKETCAMVVSD